MKNSLISLLISLKIIFLAPLWCGKPKTVLKIEIAWKMKEIWAFAQTDRQTDREFNYRGHSYPLWIVGVSGPIYNKGCILKPIYFRINNCSDTVFLPPVSTLSPSFYPLSFPISVSLISRSVLLDPMETVSVRLVWVTLEFLKYVTVLFI